MGSTRGQTGSLKVLHFLLGLFLVDGLELLPSSREVLLNSNSNFTVVCSGWSPVTWRLPTDSPLDGVTMETQGSSSVLKLVNATWRNSGRYTCDEAWANQSRDIDIFIPGGDNISSSVLVPVLICCFLFLLFFIIFFILRRRRSQSTRSTGRLEENVYVEMKSHHDNKTKDEEKSQYVPCHPVVSMETPITEPRSVDEDIYV